METKLIRASDVMEMLSISKATLWRWVNNGTIPDPVRIGRARRWHKQDIEAIANPEPAHPVRKRKRRAA